MLRSLIVPLLAATVAAAPAGAALWPERFSEYSRTADRPITVQDQPVWDEYGLEEAEQATYSSPAGQFQARAYRLKDPTSAFAIFQWKTPANAKPSDLRDIAAETETGTYLLIGNYYIEFEGRKPAVEELQELVVILPRLDLGPLPSLTRFLPKQNLIPGSRRFVIGPASLAKFEGRISPSLAAFSLGAEAQLGRFRSPAGELNLALFSYPTPQIARDRFAEFEKLPGARAKRSGPLVAVTLDAPSADEAEKLLAQVNYQVNVTWSQPPVDQQLSFGNFLIAVFTFIGVLLLFTSVAGLGYAGFRIASRKWLGAADEAMLTLHLEDR